MVFYLILGTLMLWLRVPGKKKKERFEHLTCMISKTSKQYIIRKKNIKIAFSFILDWTYKRMSLVLGISEESSSNDNYHLVTTASLVSGDLVAIILNHLEGFLNSRDNLFGFKHDHEVDRCAFCFFILQTSRSCVFVLSLWTDTRVD